MRVEEERSMLQYLRYRKEQKTLLASFDEAAAISSWLAIQILEENEVSAFLDEDLLPRIKKLVDSGFAHAEQKNNRAAYIFFREVWQVVDKRHPDAINRVERLRSGLNRLLSLEVNVINPLWEKHKDRLVSVGTTKTYL